VKYSCFFASLSPYSYEPPYSYEYRGAEREYDQEQPEPPDTRQ
jgi:hypothetical protein